MKVLALQASPHRGNTWRRVEALGEVLMRNADMEFEHLELADLDLKPCRGCFCCFQDGHQACPLQDDGVELLRKLDEADGVIFATPVYSMHVSWLMKVFVDRFAFVFHRPRFFGKYAVGLAVTGGTGQKEALKYIRMFSGSWGFRYLGDLKYIDPPVGSSLPRLMPEKDMTGKVARKLLSALQSSEPVKPSMSELLHFHIMRSIYRRMAPFLPRDHHYWESKGWLEPHRGWFTREKGPILKSVWPRTLGFFIGIMMDSRIRKMRKDGEL